MEDTVYIPSVQVYDPDDPPMNEPAEIYNGPPNHSSAIIEGKEFEYLEDYRANRRWRKAMGIILKPIIKDKHPGRNEPCPCGSGKKFKHCHGSSFKV